MNDTPRQCKLLGATVRGIGLVVAVSTTLSYCYAVIEGSDGVSRRVAFADLRRDEVTFPVRPQPYRTQMERVAVGTWDEVFSLLPTAHEQPITLIITHTDDTSQRAA